VARTAELLDGLRHALGPGGVLDGDSDLARYSRDWSGDHVGVPLAVLRPSSTDKVQEIVRRCAGAGVPLVPQGGHTGLVDGATPSADGRELVVSLERMNRIRRIDALDFSMVAEAGCILADVKAAAAEADLFFPLTLGAQGSCQIGGNIATNAGGLNVLRYGMTRALVLGLEVVLPNGDLVEDLRSLRKNNTGYDLKQLFIGSEGTLGIITAAALRLYPRPTRRETVLLGCPSLPDVIRLFGRARRELGDLISAFELMTRAGLEAALESGGQEPFDPPTPTYVILEAATSARVDLRTAVEGFLADAMEAGLVENGAMAESEAQAASFWRLREALIEWQVQQGRHMRSDVALPISALPAFLAATEAAVGNVDAGLVLHAFGHVGDGNLHLNVMPPEGMAEAEAEALLARCEAVVFGQVDAFGGTISAEHGIGRKKRQPFEARLSPAVRALSLALRECLDQAGMMSPGRLFDTRVKSGPAAREEEA
jgi:FAD/FMN-containing dehydrogenase